MSCYTCIAGTYSNWTGVSTCVGYPGNFVSANGAVICDCLAGYTTSNDNTCTQCLPGQFKNTVGNEACKSCDPGTYSESIGVTTCSTCDPGKYSNATGSHSSITCLTCPKATYSSQRSSTCTSCPVNSDTSGCSFTGNCDSSYHCVCNVGYYDQDGGLCTTCAAGKYKDFSDGNCAEDCCIQCETGKYSTSGASTCVVCPDNSVSANGVSICKCNAGYTTSNGST